MSQPLNLFEVEMSRTCLTVYHDGSCPLCRREIALVRKLTAPEAVTFVDVSGSAGQDVVPGLTADQAMRRFHVRRADGRLVSGAAAFLEMWAQSPRLRFLNILSRRPLIVAFLDLVYGAFLAVRPTISRAVGRFDR